MKKEFKELMIISALLILISTSMIFLKPEITGKITYQYEEKVYEWNFNNSNDYIYDESKISLDENQAKLIQIAEDNSYEEEVIDFSLVESALKNEEDNTDKIASIDNKNVVVNKENIFDVAFDNELNNEDVINLHLEKNKETKIYLCGKSIECNSSNYRFLNYDGNEGLYSITIKNLDEPEDVFNFNIDDEPVKFNYINASYTKTIFHEIINYTYYSSSIETKDLKIENIYKFGAFNSDENLNSQIVVYEYSTDSGDSWDEIEYGDSLNDLNSNKIRFRINMKSDNTATPVINSLSINYIVKQCIPNWECSLWSICSSLNTKIRNCIDLNGCNSEIDKPNETEKCVYYTDYYEFKEENKTISIEKNVTTRINSSDVVLDILTEENADFVNFSIKKYENHSKEIPNKTKLNKFVDVNADIIVKNAVLKIPYNENELGNINEESLKIYYYNEILEEWQFIDSYVNVEENYIYANLTHLSTYGVFGDEINNGEQSEEETSPENENSGGGGRITTNSNNNTNINSTIINQNIMQNNQTKQSEEKNENNSEKIKDEIKTNTNEIKSVEKNNIFNIITGRAVNMIEFAKKGIIEFMLVVSTTVILALTILFAINFFFKRKDYEK